jgi:nitrite reductase/ring-hydroxylating ferredoxin subunit
MKQVLCGKDELAPGEIRKVQLGPIPVVVIRARDGNLYALTAKCLHQGGPLEAGVLYEHMTPANEVGEYVPDEACDVLKCPWHGYEYDIRTGCVIADPTRRLQQFSVREEGDDIVVELTPPRLEPAVAASV